MPPKGKNPKRGRGRAKTTKKAEESGEETDREASEAREAREAETARQDRLELERRRVRSPTPPDPEAHRAAAAAAAAAVHDKDSSGLSDMDQADADKSKKKTKRAKRDPLRLSEAESADMAEWLRQNPILYDRNREDFHLKPKREKLWQRKAEELKVEDYKRLRTWYYSQRTKYSKLTNRGPSGGGAMPPLSTKDQWVLDNFEFCKSHIIRQPRRTGQSVSFFPIFYCHFGGEKNECTFFSPILLSFCR